MFYISTPIKTYTLGNNIFYAEECGRYVMCDTKQQVLSILEALGFKSKTISHVERLNESATILHRCGERLAVRIGSRTYDTDSILALGTPKGVDTTKPLTIVYRRTQ